jgi:hypothetical protein
VIRKFPHPYEAHGALNYLHELVSRFYWICMLFLPAHLVVFQFFVPINSCGRVLKLNQCLCD